MITTRAPGKLFVAGEYAVVEPGEQAVLVAVDRYVTVRVTEGGGAGTVHSPDRTRLPLVWRRDRDGVRADVWPHPYGHVLSVLTVVERLRAERGIPARYADLRIESELDDASGRKLGLGSSGAVTVATVRALDRFYGLDLSEQQVFRLALLATIRVTPTASGGDVAASTFGGWVRYCSPDRAVLRESLENGSVRELLDADEPTGPWAGLTVEPVPAPRALRLLVGWTGTPASTERQVGEARRRRDPGALGHAEFLAASHDCVGRLVHGLRTGDDGETMRALRDARRVLAELAAQTGLTVETARLGALCDAAEAGGAAAKPSGAGGGDCGIALAPDGSDVGPILAGWRACGVRPLALAAAPRSEAPIGRRTR
ncbi:phosphomevalonate kinase [Xylanimonas sp. McL0601]|uniref:phosphomevalonate kinase n=1 Tax=Xylanimonas sp. McL0601 TaxID=3414739 RepID=UPI003CECE6C9